MGDLERTNNWIREALAPRASDKLRSGSTNPSQSYECPVCQDTGVVSIQSADMAAGIQWKQSIAEAITAQQAELNKLQGFVDTGKAPVTVQLERARVKMGELVLAKARGYEGSITAAPCVCADAREGAMLRRRIERFNRLPPGVAEHMTFESFKALPGLQEAVEAVKEMAFGEPKHSLLLLSGMYGTGKTHLLVALVQAMTAALRPARYRYVPTLLQELRSTFDRKDDTGPDLAGLLESYSHHGLLGLDDMGAGKEQPSPWSIEQMETIINARYESGSPLVVTSNLGVREFGARWGGRIADRLFDRRTGKARQVMIQAQSYRTGVPW